MTTLKDYRIAVKDEVVKLAGDKEQDALIEFTSMRFKDDVIGGFRHEIPIANTANHVAQRLWGRNSRPIRE